MLLALTLVPRHPVLLYFFHFYSLYGGIHCSNFKQAYSGLWLACPHLCYNFIDPHKASVYHLVTSRVFFCSWAPKGGSVTHPCIVVNAFQPVTTSHSQFLLTPGFMILPNRVKVIVNGCKYWVG
jgi:hypothetical protein